MTDNDHAMYESPPVALVAVEIRFPGEIGAPVPSGVYRALGEVLGDEWVMEQVQQPAITVNLGAMSSMPTLVGGAGGFPSGAILRFSVRDRTTAVALTAGSLTVETTHYGNWPRFRSVLEKAVGTTEKVLRPAGVTRVGMRYVNEVRVSGVDGPDWAVWLSPAVLPPAAQVMNGMGWVPLNWTGTAQYQAGQERYLVLRYGPQPPQPGFAVSPDGPLRRPGPRPSGSFFLLDFDAFWQPSAIPKWDSDVVLETCDQLRQPVRALFDQVITRRLVAESFNKKESR
jgi:uncharacterized protein (TIGR04255 family)